jgi:hypothetical protein
MKIRPVGAEFYADRHDEDNSSFSSLRTRPKILITQYNYTETGRNRTRYLDETGQTLDRLSNYISVFSVLFI